MAERQRLVDLLQAVSANRNWTCVGLQPSIATTTEEPCDCPTHSGEAPERSGQALAPAETPRVGVRHQATSSTRSSVASATSGGTTVRAKSSATTTGCSTVHWHRRKTVVKTEHAVDLFTGEKALPWPGDTRRAPGGEGNRKRALGGAEGVRRTPASGGFKRRS